MTKGNHARLRSPRRRRIAVAVALPALLLISTAATGPRHGDVVAAAPGDAESSDLQTVSRTDARASRSTDRDALAPPSSLLPSASAVVSDAAVDVADVAKKKAAARLAAAHAKAAAAKRAAAQKAAARKQAERRAARRAAQKKAAATATVVGHRYATTALNLRSRPSLDARLITVLDRATRLDVTSLTDGDWRAVKVNGRTGWVRSAYVAKDKPESTTSPSPGRSSTAACPSGSAVESGLSSNAIKVHRAVCAAFPSVTAYGGVGGGGEHASGHAVDIMIGGNSGLGNAISAWARANASSLGVSEVIWSQRIWTVQRSGEGWRGMSDRGSATANHYDHVHVTVY